MVFFLLGILLRAWFTVFCKGFLSPVLVFLKVLWFRLLSAPCFSCTEAVKGGSDCTEGRRLDLLRRDLCLSCT